MVVLATSCRKKAGEPEAKICANKTSYVKQDTIILENCSKNFTKQRWILPDGTHTTNGTVYFVPASVGTYKFSLYVSNDDYIYDYEAYTYIDVN